MSRTGQERGKRAVSKHFRQALAERDGMDCAICGNPIRDLSKATCDHIIPASQGGTDRIENLRLAHFHCNGTRGTGGLDRAARVAHREGRLG